MFITCCKGCQERKVGCHVVCERYLVQKEELEKQNKIKQANKSIERAAVSYAYDRDLAIKRHNKKNKFNIYDK